MSNCLLTQLVFGALVAVFSVCGCAKDSILEAAESMDDEPALGEAEAGVMPGAEPAIGIPQQPQPGQGNAEEGGVVKAPTPKPGIPEEPEPAKPGSIDQTKPPPGGDGVAAPPPLGIPEDPQPAPPGSPGGAEHAGKDGGSAGEVQVGPQVILRGRVSGAASSATIRIDLFDGDQRKVSGPRPKVVGVHEIERPGVFDVSVPIAAKRVWVGAYADINGNKRPDKGEPAGWYGRNPVHMDAVPKLISIALVVEGKAAGLGLDFGE